MIDRPAGARGFVRLGPVLGLFVLAPISAEYLLGYDDTVGHPVQLAFGLLIFGPLYGAPAVIIREVTRRRGRGWPTIVLLATAAGLVQAGLIDQSLFNPDYRDIPYWQSMRQPTYIPALGTSVSMILGFVGGHLIQSFAGPIAVIESTVPTRARQPWLGRPGLVIMLLLYAAAAALVLVDQAHSEQFVASTGQLVGAAAVVVALVVLALAVPRRPATDLRRTPSARWVGAAAVAALLVVALMPTTWWGVGGHVLALTVLSVLLHRWSRRVGWSSAHVLAAGAAPLLVNAANAFRIDPLGEVSALAKYATNTTLAVGVVVLVLWAASRARAAGPDPARAGSKVSSGR